MPKELDENFFATGIRKSDGKAMDQLYEKFCRTLYHFALKLVGDSHLAADLVSESFIKIWIGIEDVTSVDHFRNRLFLICKRDALKMLTRDQKTISLDDQQHFDPADEANMEQEAIHAEVVAEIFQLIDLLPEKCQEVFKLSYFGKMSPAQIAARLGISESTVRNQKARAIEIIRSKLKPR